VVKKSIKIQEYIFFALHKDLSYYEDFLEEDKEWESSGSYKKLSWIEISRTRNIPVYTKRINFVGILVE